MVMLNFSWETFILGGRGLLSEKTIEHLIRAIDDAGGSEKINNGEKQVLPSAPL